jgi:hypothetical protein
VRYDHFSVALLDRNDVVRTLDLEVTGKNASTARNIRVWPTAKWDDVQYEMGAAHIRPVDPGLCKH